MPDQVNLTPLLERVVTFSRGAKGRPPRVDREALAHLLPSVDGDPAVVAATKELELAREGAGAASKALEAASSKVKKTAGTLAKAIAAGRDLAHLRTVRAEGRDDHDELSIMRTAVAVAQARVLEAERQWQEVVVEAAGRVATDLHRRYRQPLLVELEAAQQRLAALTILRQAVDGRISATSRPRQLMVTIRVPGVAWTLADGSPITSPVGADEAVAQPVTTLRRVPVAEAERLVAAGEAEWAEPWRADVGEGVDHEA